MYMADTFSKGIKPATKTQPASSSGTASKASSKPSSSAEADASNPAESSFQSLLQQRTKQNLSTDQPSLQVPSSDIPSDSEALAEALAALMLFQPQLPTAVQAMMSVPASTETVTASTQAVPAQLSTAMPLPAEQTAPTLAPLTQTEAQAPLVIPTQTKAPSKVADAPTTDAPTSPTATEQGTKISVSSSSESDTPDFSSSAEPQTRTLFQNTEHIPVKVGDTPLLDTKSTDFDAQLSRQISQALDRGEQKLSIRLAPENLGTVLVELTRAPDGALSLLLHASNPTAANLLQDRSSELSGLLRNSTGAPVYVEVQQQQDRPPFHQQQEQQGHAQQDAQQQQQQQQSQTRQQSQDFLEQLRLGITSLDTEAS